MSTERRSQRKFDPSTFDWSRVDATTEDDIDQQIAEDPNTAPALTEAELQRVGRPIRRDEVEDVRAIRHRLGLSQRAFADRFGFSVDAIRQYESGRRTPTGAVRTLLRVIAHEPDAVTRALARPALVPVGRLAVPHR